MTDPVSKNDALKSAQVVLSGQLAPGQGLSGLLKEVCSREKLPSGVLQLDDGASIGYLGIAGKQIFGAFVLPVQSSGFDALKRILSMQAKEYTYFALQDMPAVLNQSLKLEIERLLNKAAEIVRTADGAKPSLSAARKGQNAHLQPARNIKQKRIAESVRALASGEIAPDDLSPQESGRDWSPIFYLAALAAAAALIVTIACVLYGKSHFSAAAAALRNGNNQLAIEQSTQALASDNKLIPAYMLRAVAYSRLGNSEKAAADYTTVLQSDPRNVKALLGRACQFIAMGSTDEALSDCRRALTVNTHAADAYLLSAMAYAKQKQHDEAIAACRHYLKESADSGSKGRMADVYATLAQAHQDAGEFGQALLYFDKAIELRGGVSDLLLKRARAFIAAGDFPHALSDAEKSLASQQTDEAFLLRAKCHEALDQKQAALADLKQALQIWPQDIALLKQRGELELRLNRIADAIKDFQAVLAIAPADAEAQIRLEQTTAKAPPISAQDMLANNNTSATGKASDITLSGDAASLTKQGYTLLESGRTALAVKAFTQALQLSPGSALARRYLAHALTANGQFSAAVQQFRMLAKISSLSFDDQLANASAMDQSGDTDGAIAEFENCLAARPENKQSRLALIDLYERTGRISTAKRLAMEGAIRATTKDDTDIFRGRLRELEAPKVQRANSHDG